MEITKAKLEDIDEIKKIADVNKNAIGFVIRASLIQAIEKNELIVAKTDKIIGFLNYHHRLDSQCTIYEIAVSAEYRRIGIGKSMINALIIESTEKNKSKIILKCPSDSESNKFYNFLGFSTIGRCPGKIRELTVWEYRTFLYG